MDQAKGKVAVYGSLRKGLHNHSLLEDATFLGSERIKGFNMHSLGSFPFITTRGSTDKSEITIEVYEVTPAEFRRLDTLEGYPSFYDRTLVDTSHGQAWIYFIDKDGSYSTVRNERVTDGDWLKFLNPLVSDSE